jgi:uncharacterized membrane protein
MSDFRRFFGRGLAVLLPSILTLWLLWYAFVFVFNNVAEPINRGLRRAIVDLTPVVLPERKWPDWYRVTEEDIVRYRAAAEAGPRRDAAPERVESEIRYRDFRDYWDARWYLQATGLLVAITLIYLAGVLLGGLIGRKVYARLETLIARLPGFKQVYPHVKQLVEMVMGDKPMAFKRVVLVEYPRKGVWSLGLVTSAAMQAVSDLSGRPALTVFVPSTPTPFTGFAISVPEDEVINLPISIDEAIRFVLTGGVLIPGTQIGAAPPPRPEIGTGPGDAA